jgi:hypothetical protein
MGFFETAEKQLAGLARHPGGLNSGGGLAGDRAAYHAAPGWAVEPAVHDETNMLLQARQPVCRMPSGAFWKPLYQPIRDLRLHVLSGRDAPLAAGLDGWRTMPGLACG